MARSPRLFEHDLPPGLHYRDDFITESEEGELLDAIAGISFSNFEMRGVVARRRVAFLANRTTARTAGPLPSVGERNNHLRSSPQTAFTLHADREHLQRPEQRQIAWRAGSHDAQSTAGRASCEALDRPRGVPEFSQDALNDGSIVAKLFVQRSEDEALRTSAICISKTLDHVDGCICARQVFAQVGCEGLSRVIRLVALPARRASKCDRRDRQADRT